MKPSSLTTNQSTANTDRSESTPAGLTRDPPGSASTGFVVRALSLADWPAAKAVDAAAFGYEPDHEFLDNISLPAQDIGRFTGVFDPTQDDLLIGIGAIQSRNMTFPGRGPLPVAGVTWVGVRPDQQRRGVLREVMTAQLHGLHENGGEPVAILTASEGGIYGRFGYGPAAGRFRLVCQIPTELRPGTPVERVREVPRDQALTAMPAIYAAAQQQFVGHLSRSEANWAQLVSEHPKVSRSRSPFRFAVHHDGYAAYHLTENWNERGPDYTLEVVELCATTAVARASLWQHLLHYPMVRTVRYRMAWTDEPLQDLLANPRVLELESADHVWVRLVDLDRALAVRGYSTPTSVVVRVVDEFCPWNDGTWRLTLSASGGGAAVCADPAEITLSITDLGAAFLGGTRIARLAAAGRVVGDGGAIMRLDAAFATPLRPWTPEGF